MFFFPHLLRTPGLRSTGGSKSPLFCFKTSQSGGNQVLRVFAVDLKGFTFPSADFVIHGADPPRCAARIPSPPDDESLRPDNFTVAPVPFNTTPRIPRCATTDTNFTPSQIVAECDVGKVCAPRGIVRSKTPTVVRGTSGARLGYLSGETAALSMVSTMSNCPPIVIRIMDTLAEGEGIEFGSEPFSVYTGRSIIEPRIRGLGAFSRIQSCSGVGVPKRDDENGHE